VSVRGRRAVLRGGVLGISAALLFLVARFDPSRTSLFPPCLFFLATGWACPGCGATRALHAALAGDWRLAFALNPLLAVVPPALFLLAAFHRRAIGRPARVRVATACAWLIAAVVIGFGVWRNTASYPLAHFARDGRVVAQR